MVSVLVMLIPLMLILIAWVFLSWWVADQFENTFVGVLVLAGMLVFPVAVFVQIGAMK